MLSRLNIFKKLRLGRGRPSKDEVSEIFRFKYACFKELLDSNMQLLNIITDIEEKLRGRQVFGMSYVRSQAARAVFHSLRLAKSLDSLSGGRYPLLFKVVDRINASLKEELEKRKELPLTELILPFSRINKDMVDWVGGKNANLGEVQNLANLPIPRGFAVTTRAFTSFLEHNDLVDEINKRKMELDPEDPESVGLASEDIQKLIISAQVPGDLATALESAYDQMSEAARGEGGGDSLWVALRSSAIGEDSELSFAGQYVSLLNVPREQLTRTYKYIVASLYTPRAIAYRLGKGIRDEDIAMSVGVLEMVDSVAAGVMYSHHPFNVLEDKILISAVWGLGPYAVEGVISPDTYLVDKDQDLTLVHSQISPKPVQLAANPDGGLREIPVAPELQDQPCLTPEQIKTLAGYALKLEEHYKGPQDVEWALDRTGRLIILQTRPLHLEAAEDARSIPQVSGYPVLVEGGAVAFPGVGCGPAFHITDEDDLTNFPEGAVLVAKHSSPKFVLVMPKAQAIVTDAGSVTGHMASLTREFGVPSLLDTKVGTQAIPEGTEITVDAYSGRVYQGRVAELLALRRTPESHMENTPVYGVLKKVSEYIVPLTMVDPRAANFAPEFCRSLHDVGRLVHEFSYKEMFQISDLVSDQKAALRLVARIPLDLYLIDLGGGVAGVSERATKVRADQITSAPFKALLKGMMHPDLQAMEPRPVEFSGFFAVMREQMMAPPKLGDRFGDRSYAIISDKYLNFSSRVGYHYSVLDAYCGKTVNKNYITFSFKGGAADEARRNRRVRAIASVLVALDFAVEVKEDRVDARLQKYDCAFLEEKLDQLGRLLLFTRQMDMLMTAEVSVEAVAQNFLQGNYHLDEGFFKGMEK